MGVVPGAVDVARVRRCWNRCPTTYTPSAARDAAALADAAVRRPDRQPQPGVVGAEAGGDQDGADALGAQVQLAGAGGHLDRSGSGSGHTSPARPVRSTNRSKLSRRRSGPGRRPRRWPQVAPEPGPSARDRRQAPDQPDAAGVQAGEVEVRGARGRGRCDRPAAARSPGGRPLGRAPRRWCGPGGRSRRATRRGPCRGSGAASGCGDRRRGSRPGPSRLSSSAICGPDAEAPTTRTPPGARRSGLR